MVSLVKAHNLTSELVYIQAAVKEELSDRLQRATELEARLEEVSTRESTLRSNNKVIIDEISGTGQAEPVLTWSTCRLSATSSGSFSLVCSTRRSSDPPASVTSPPCRKRRQVSLAQMPRAHRLPR